jgi:hypothetical protein
MLSIDLVTPPIATITVYLCLIATLKVFSDFEALIERSYHKLLYL